MNESNLAIRQARRLHAVRLLGRIYLAYHTVFASVIVVSFLMGTRPGYWRDAVPVFAVLIVLYPLAIPALVACGGLHNCGGSPLTVLALPILLVTLFAAGSAIWVAFSFLRRLRLRSS
jgi:hypothetical protein